MGERPPTTDPGAALRRRRAARQRVIRRRRLVAAAGLVALTVLVVVALGGIGGGTTPQRGRTTAGVATVPVASRRAPTLSPRERERRREAAAVAAFQRRSWFITHGGSGKKEIALTFDDGPGPYSERLLDVLRRKHAAATYFEVGFMVRYFNDALKEQLRLGYPVGDHTEDHKNLAALSAADQRREIEDQTQWITKYGGPKPTLFRAPYGAWNATTKGLLQRAHMLAVFWSVDTDDWRQPGTQAIVDRVLDGAHPGAIVLLHDAGGTRTQTIAALPTIIDTLRRRGYTLVTVPRLIADDPPSGHQREPLGLEGD
jgi:peptidoglycan/xylan/chitin deacetylase (PgdA/CDA1 family)